MIKQIDARVQPTDLSIVETKTNRGVLFQMSMKAKFTDRLNRGFVIHAEMTLDNKIISDMKLAEMEKSERDFELRKFYNWKILKSEHFVFFNDSEYEAVEWKS